MLPCVFFNIKHLQCQMITRMGKNPYKCEIYCERFNQKHGLKEN